MRCQSCGSDNPEGVKFCIECAAPFKSCCPHCGFENLPRAKFCGECATPLTEGKTGKRGKGEKENSLSGLRTPDFGPRTLDSSSSSRTYSSRAGDDGSSRRHRR